MKAAAIAGLFDSALARLRQPIHRHGCAGRRRGKRQSQPQTKQAYSCRSHIILLVQRADLTSAEQTLQS
jgi:hypothetical protein